MKKFIRVLVPLLLAVLIIASIGWYLFTYDRGFTRDFLLTQARYNDLHGNSRLSSWFYDLAYNFSNHDENVAIELANLYKADDNYTKAEYTLTNAINSEPSAELFTAIAGGSAVGGMIFGTRHLSPDAERRALPILLAAVAAIVYLVDVRPAVRGVSRGGSSW